MLRRVDANVSRVKAQEWGGLILPHKGRHPLTTVWCLNKKGKLRGRVGGNVEVQNAPTVIGQNQEDVKNVETDRGHGEEINGDHLLRVILKESSPSLRGRFVSADQVFADAAFRDVDAEFERFAMDQRRTPNGISRHILRIRSRPRAK